MRLKCAYDACRSMAVSLAVVAPLASGNAEAPEPDSGMRTLENNDVQAMTLGEPETALSEQIGHLQARFNRAYFGNTHIVVLSPDWFEINAAMNPSQEQDQNLGASTLAAYVNRNHSLQAKDQR